MQNVIEMRNVERDYGFEGTWAIVDHPKLGRLLIEDGFGGIDTLAGGAVRWRHGRSWHVKTTDTLNSLDGDIYLNMSFGCGDAERPDCRRIYGDSLANFADRLGL